MTDTRSTEDVSAAWSAWLAVLDAAGYPGTTMVRPPAAPAEVAAAEAVFGRPFPDELRAFYALSDGQRPDFPRGPGPHPSATTSLFPATYALLPLQQAIAEYRNWIEVVGPGDSKPDFDDHITVRDDDPVRARYWDPGWWPLATDGGGNSIAVDTVPEAGGAAGQLIVAGPDEDERRRVGTGVADYLRRLAGSALPPPPEPRKAGDPFVFWDRKDLR
ncbi:SMI1/KNR4 family protein [Pseudonocardia nematodicida]|uniref:SMI1/KNR4 family protein n=1 Tax=Pseudonocardia nematodicida TaxID=1206997 RepID=A0ABV1KDJ6_9PSEU